MRTILNLPLGSLPRSRPPYYRATSELSIVISASESIALATKPVHSTGNDPPLELYILQESATRPHLSEPTAKLSSWRLGLNSHAYDTLRRHKIYSFQQRKTKVKVKIEEQKP